MPCNLVLSRHVCMYVLYVDTVQGPHRENLSFYTLFIVAMLLLIVFSSFQESEKGKTEE